MKKTVFLSFLITVLLISAVSCNGDPLAGRLEAIGSYGDIKVSFIGDSITQGVNVAHPYPQVVKALLGLKEAVNLGIGGATVSNIPGKSFFPYVERTDSIDADSDIVAVQLQLNDLAYNVPIGNPEDSEPSTFTGALNYLIDAVKTRCPDAYIFIIGPNDTGLGAVQKDYADALKTAAGRNGLDYLNLFEENASFDPKRDTSDGTHHTQKYITEVLAPEIAWYIVNHYEPGKNGI